MKLAINQPYFSPYSGYFALIHAVDTFVIYDCVQFQRRGRSHRSQLHESEHFAAGWLTLPIEKAPQETLIKDMLMKPLDADSFSESQQKLLQYLEMNFDDYRKQGFLVDFLEKHIKTVMKDLDIKTHVIRSSSLNIDQELRGQERILAVCKAMEATEYYNLTGGQDLYDVQDFAAQNIDLKFLKNKELSFLGYLQAKAEGEFDCFKDESHQDRF